MQRSPALPMGNSVGGRGGVGVASRWSKRLGEGSVRRLSHIHPLAHRSL